MIWLLTEILVFVAAAAVFGGLIGLGLASSGANRRAVAFAREHQGLVDRVQNFERAQHTVEARAAARAAADAAARGDLEARLVEAEEATADYRARAEAAERRLRGAQSPADSPELVEAVSPTIAASDAAEAGAASLRAGLDAAEAARGRAELDLRHAEAERDAARSAAAAAEQDVLAERTQCRQEIASLAAQLAAAERVRAKCEADLAIAQARAEETMRSAARAGQLPAALAAGGEKPLGLAAPDGGKPDDLRRIKGIGPKNEGVLNSLGIYHYGQIAALTPANIAWLEAYMKFHGRIEDWVGQARALAEGRASTKAHPQNAGT